MIPLFVELLPSRVLPCLAKTLTTRRATRSEVGSLLFPKCRSQKQIDSL